MAIPLGKLTLIIGAGLVGSALTKEGRLSDITGFFSGALKIVTKHLQHDKDSSQSTSKPQTDSLLAQVNNLRQELQLLASSRSVTIITSSRPGSGTFGVTAVIVVGFVGYGYIWWKGWKFSDMMFVTRRGFSDACNSVGRQMDLVSSSVASAKRHLSSRIDRVDSNLDECKELNVATKDEVSKLNGNLCGIHEGFQSVYDAVQTLETKLHRIGGNQDATNQRVYRLCQFVQRFEQSRNMELTQGLPSTSSRHAIEYPENRVVTRIGPESPLALDQPSSSAVTTMGPKSPLALDQPPSSAVTTMGPKSPLALDQPSSSAVTRVVRATSVSASSLMELPEISNSTEMRNLRVCSPRVSTKASLDDEQSNNNSGSSRFGWKLPGMNLLMRSRSTAS